MRELFTPLLRFASFFFPFILFPLLDTFSPSLAFLAQSGIGNALPSLSSARFIWNFNSRLITRRLFHRHRQDLDLIRIKQHFLNPPLFFLVSSFLPLFLSTSFLIEKWSELHFSAARCNVRWMGTNNSRTGKEERGGRVGWPREDKNKKDE